MTIHRFNKQLHGITLIELYEWLEDLFPLVGQQAKLHFNFDPQSMKVNVDITSLGENRIITYAQKENQE